MSEEYERLIRIEERYNILLSLLNKNITKYNETLMISNDRIIIEFLQTIKAIKSEEMQLKVEDKKDTTEYPF